MPFGPRELLLVVILPAAAALLLIALGRRIWRATASETENSVKLPGRWAAPLATGIALLIAFPTVAGGWHVLPPQESLSWLFWIAIAAALAGVIDAQARMPWWLRAALVFLVAFASAFVAFRFKISADSDAGWSKEFAFGIFAAIAAVAVVWWASLDSLECDPSSRSAAPWVFWLISASLCIVLALLGGLTQGQFSSALAAAAGAGIVLTLVRHRRMFVRGTAIVFAVIIVILLSGGFLLIDLEPGTPALLAALLAAPVAIVIGRIIPVSRWRPWLRVIARAAPVALLLAIVTALAVATELRKPHGDGGEPEARVCDPRSGSTLTISRAI